MIIYNRDGALSSRLSGYQITVGNDANGGGQNTRVCVQNGGATTNKLKLVNVCDPPLPGRYVHVSTPGKKEYLALCEVEVYEA